MSFDYVVGYYIKNKDHEDTIAGFLTLENAAEYIKQRDGLFLPTGFYYVDAPEGKYIYGEETWKSNRAKLFNPEEWEKSYIYDAREDRNIPIDEFLPVDRFYKIKKQNTVEPEEDSAVNLFKKPMSEKEQLELSTLLDKLLVLYENNFDGLIGDIEEDADFLCYEFKSLYDMIELLSNRA